MGKKLFLLVNLLLFAAVIQAVPVSKSEAQKKAQQFISGKHAAARGTSVSTPQLKLETADDDNYYVFNVGQQQGFVIVSGDDRAPEILGYSDEGAFDAENIPDNMKAWLQGYADEINWIKQHSAKNNAAARPKRTAKAAISTLLTTQWNQYAPYNNNCPSLYKNGTPAVTGCVATATAQIMFYQAKTHYIESTTTSSVIPSYQSTKYYWYFEGEQYTGMPEKPITEIDWTKIDATLTTEDARNEVARLFEYVGAAVQMQYGLVEEGGSSASNEAVVTALVNYFGYDPDAKSVYRDDHSYDDWVDVIYGELSTNGPVLLGGQSSGGGHAFVVDGYDSDDYFHINWGWGGISDGYFLLSALNPDDQGAGGSSSSDGYNSDQVAMINVSPTDDGLDLSDEACLTVDVDKWIINYNTAEWNNYYNNYFYRDNSLHYLQIDFSLSNASGWDLDFDWGVALYNNDNFVSFITDPKKQSFSNRMTRYGLSDGLKFPQKLANGEYRLVAVCRKSGTETWRPCIDSDKYYVKAIVSSNYMTLQNISSIPVEAYSTDGKPMTVDIVDGNVSVPNDILAIDFTNAEGLTTVTPNNNPNTLYIVSGLIPNGLNGKNVVKNGVAEMLTLIDSSIINDNTEHCGFYTPINFTAMQISYERVFEQGTDGTGSGWTTIVLPFDVDKVTVGEKEIDWFHSSSDTGKNFWLRELVSDGEGSVTFGYVDELKANTPYIIAVPDNTWGNKWDLTNKTLKFIGKKDANIEKDAETETNGDHYTFVGTTIRQTLTDVYALNNTGSTFVHGEATIAPFRAYFTPIASSNASRLIIRSAGGQTTSIMMPEKEPLTTGDVYTLDGRKVKGNLPKGVYIVNGKKMIK